MEIKINITSCKECPNFDQERIYTSDSWEMAFDWFCKKAGNRKIQGYVERSDEKNIKIPEWCPCK
jgi:hypothetical protein